MGPRALGEAATGPGRCSLVIVAAVASLGLATQPAAVSTSGRAPSARPGPPTALTVDGLPAPVGVDPGSVALGWHVADPRRGARQSAYRVLVAARRTADPSDRSVVWDSGDRRSARQAFVPYGGPPLAPDTTYWWTVRTRDGTGTSGPFARPTRFDTGLRDADWKADWVRPGPAEPGPDEYTDVRKEVTLARSPIARAVAYVAAAHQYELWINGRRADEGPSFAYPDAQYFQATDVTSLVRPGARNALGVLHHWYGAGQGRPESKPALIVQISVTHRDGAREVVTTDGTWREHAAEWRAAPPRNDEGDFVERIDGRASPLGWSEPGFDDHAWSPVAVLGPHPVAPFTHLVSQRTRVVEHAVRPVSLRRLRSGAYVADFGSVIAAVPAVTFRRGAAGRRVAMHAGFLLDRDGSVSTTRGTQGTDMSYAYVERTGVQTFRPFVSLAFRYLQIDAPRERLARRHVIAFARHAAMPDEAAATFHSSNATLDAVWKLARHSALYGSQEQFLDTPTREKGQFLADAFDVSQTTMRAFGEQNLTWQALRDFARSQARYWPDGRANAVYPNGDGARDIPDYTELYPEWVQRYYESTGDRATLEELSGVVANVADYVARYEDPATGLVTRLAGGGGDYAFGIVDWPPAMRYGYDLGTVARTTVNVLAVDVFHTVAVIDGELHRADDAARQEERARQLTAAINARLTRPDGIYVDGLEADSTQSPHASQQANAEALAFGVVPPDRVAAVAAYTASLGLAMGPMHGLTLLRAFHDGGRDTDLVRLLTDRAHPGWARIVAAGGTYTWETWTPSDAEGDSMSHAWGATALVAIQEALLGVTPVDPGFDLVEIRPPAGGLSAASGRVPTEGGPVTVTWARHRRGRVTVDVRVPANDHAIVDVPTDSVARVTVDGRSAVRSPAVEVLGLAGPVARFEIGAGTYAFAVR